MPAFKYAAFALELPTLPPELRLMEKVCEEFKRMPLAAATCWQQVCTVDEAASHADEFRALTCGSPFDVAFINLNLFTLAKELNFLLSDSVLGDPRTVFAVSLRGMAGPAYQVAKEKVDRELAAIARGTMAGGPSCLDSYSIGNTDDTAMRVARIMHAHLEEEERRTRARQQGTILPPSFSLALEIMRKSPSIYCGRRPGGTSGVFARPGGLLSPLPGSFPAPDAARPGNPGAPPPPRPA